MSFGERIEGDQELERRAVDPMQVVDHEHERLLGRERCDEPLHRSANALLEHVALRVAQLAADLYDWNLENAITREARQLTNYPFLRGIPRKELEKRLSLALPFAGMWIKKRQKLIRKWVGRL